MDTNPTAKHFELVEMICALSVRGRFNLENAHVARRHYAFDNCVSRAWGVLVERGLAAWDGKGTLDAWVKVVARRECAKELDLHAYRTSDLEGVDDSGAGYELPAVSAAMHAGNAKHHATPAHKSLPLAERLRASNESVNVKATSGATVSRCDAPDLAATIDGARMRQALDGAVAGLTEAEQAFWAVAMGASDQNAIAAELGWSAAKVSRYMKSVPAKLRAMVNPE